MLDSFEERNTNPDVVVHTVRMVGGSAAVTKVYGPGIAVTRTDTGDYLLTWSENPGTFIGHTYGLQATTISALAGHTVVVGAFDTTAFTLALTLTDASEAAHDLAALEWITLDLKFAHNTALL